VARTEFTASYGHTDTTKTKTKTTKKNTKTQQKQLLILPIFIYSIDWLDM
jgi:hypothetical protein